MTILPSRLKAMLERGLCAVKDDGQLEELGSVANAVATATWQHWQACRPPEDNRPEHEWIVFANIIKIAECEGLDLSEKRIAIGSAFTHDTFFIPRITEAMIRAAKEKANEAKETDSPLASRLSGRAEELQIEKRRQRRKHMEGGAQNARLVLGQLEHPDSPGVGLFTSDEIERCVDIIAKHDLWKMREPHPPGTDRLAVVCLEADALWPLHPLGVLADLERPDEDGKVKDATDPAEWRNQLQNSIQTLLGYRDNWKNSVGESFIDGESIFRTQEGHRLYREWRAFWNL